MPLLETTIAAIRPLLAASMAQAQARQNQLTKPPGSLGRLEELSIQLAGITGQLQPSLEHKHVVVMVGDHGVAAAGVSAYPAEVTPQMVYNFLSGGAAISVLARHVGAAVTVVDMGVGVPIHTDHPHFLDCKIGLGTRNILAEPAMSPAQARQAVETGIEVVNRLAETAGLDLLITGDMGIGNTTPSTAIAAVMTDVPIKQIAGRGTGLDEAGLARKIGLIEEAVAQHEPYGDALDILAKVGGFEIGGIAGLILAAAARRIPVIVDGFISTAAALIAAGLCPAAKAYMISGHSSAERGQQAMLAHLGLMPLLDLNLRLGEGSGAALCVPLLEAAVKILNEMATFSEAGVSQG
jgi:nicotinate-nucleotide--dimethylbenzimidazole phosphoribosyltransferase